MTAVFLRVLIPACFLLLAGCVTETTGRQTPEVSSEEAAELNLQLGVGYLRQNDWQAAQRKLEKAIELQPDLVPAHITLALVYEQLGDGPGADRHYRQAVKLAPRDPDALNSLAAFLCRQEGQREEALSYFDRAIDVPLSEKFSNKAVLNTNAGVCVKPLDFERAETYLRAALAVDGNFTPALVQMADVAYERKNFLQSRAFLERYIAAAPTTPAVLWLGVRIETALGDSSAAQKYGVRLVEEFPESVEAGLLLEQERDAG